MMGFGNIEMVMAEHDTHSFSAFKSMMNQMCARHMVLQSIGIQDQE